LPQVLRFRRFIEPMSDTTSQTASKSEPADAGRVPVPAPQPGDAPRGERPALDPTRYGDWEKNGRCIDF
jgi:hypothetical protein